MTWAKVAVALGSSLLVLGFCLGVDTPISTTVAGQSYACADVITPGMLVSGQSTSDDTAPDTRTPAERRLDARVEAGCDPLERGTQLSVWGSLGFGGLVLLTGWTALREREHDRLAAHRLDVVAGV